MQTNPDLAALSEAANAAEKAACQEPGNGRLLDAYITALSAYNGALRSLHRSGDLVLIDRKGMQERAANAIYTALNGHITSAWPWQRLEGSTKDFWLNKADAAIAAILGDVKP